MATQKLSGINRVLVGFTLFSMFFGAGNLIFPPSLAAQAGVNTVEAISGFMVSAVGLPVFGVAAVALSGGLPKLADRVGPRFSFLFVLLIYLSIGPCLAIPRTASTSFEMTMLPLMEEMGIHLGGQMAGISYQTVAQFFYSLLFFLVAMLLAFRPEKLTDRLGKILCPALLTLISVLFLGCLVWPMGQPGKAAEIYSSQPAVKGFLDGYQTMDTIAALNFGIIIALNIQNRGVKQEAAVVRETVIAGMIAGVLMMAVYGILAYIGMPVGEKAGDGANGARILTFVAGSLFGNAGKMILGVIFFIACLNTCVGLLSCCSQYFTTILPKICYRAWVFLFAFISLFISSAGLDRILAFSLPVLNAIYPIAIVLIVLAFLHRFLGHWEKVYPCAILFTGIVSGVHALESAGVLSSQMCMVFYNWLPGYSIGLGWILPAGIGILLGILLGIRSHRS